MTSGLCTIQSALIAIYISRTKEHSDEIKRLANRKLILEHFITLIEKGIGDIETETHNYREFCEELKKEGLGKLALQTTPFFLLERATDEISGELFNAITENKSDEDKQTYIEIIKCIHNALFLKKLSEDQYFRFIKDFNIQADKLLVANKNFNVYYKDLMEFQVYTGFHDRLIEVKSEFNKSSANDISTNSDYGLKKYEVLVDNLRILLKDINYPEGSEIFNSLVSLIEEYYIPVNKMKEINQNTEGHFQSIIEKMADIAENLKENLEIIRR